MPCRAGITFCDQKVTKKSWGALFAIMLINLYWVSPGRSGRTPNPQNILLFLLYLIFFGFD